MEIIWNMGITWIIFLQNLGSWLKTPMEIFSFFGTENFFLLLLPALYWCMEAGIGLRVGIILLLSTSVNDALKMAFHGPRPYWYSTDVIGYAIETSFGVPSGHAQIAVGVWGMLAASLRKWWGWLIAILIILLIGISRLYLGVHFPHDVILGWLIGALLMWLVLHFWKPVTAWLKKMSLGQQILASFLGSLVLILFSLIPFLYLVIANWQPPQAWAGYAINTVSMSGAFTTAGTLFGLLAGLAWFNRQGGFDANGPIWKRILRYVLGVVGVLVLYLGLKVLFGLIVPDTEAVFPYILRYIRYVLVGAWISSGAPWFFVKLKLARKAV
ncbi:MAG: phosphatase PAP2 family protein [Chloroflexi bacterium]|nr:phosphatase PAP2 family protein [Chloroflexota bacterium]